MLTITFTLVSAHVSKTYAYSTSGGYGSWNGYYYPYYMQYYPYTTVVSPYPWWAYAYYFSPDCYAYTNQCYFPESSSYYLPKLYQLTIDTDPSALSNLVSGSGTYYSGSTATISTNQTVIQVSQDTRYVFSHWKGDYSGNGTSVTITMDSSKIITAVYQLQYYLSVTAQPSVAPTPLGGNGWYNAGNAATLIIPEQTINQTAESRLAFSGWNVDGTANQTGSSLSVMMDAAHTVVAQYTQQYYLNVTTNQGVTSGQGWYNAGSNAQISVSTPPSPMFGVNWVFDGWQGSAQSSSQSTTVQVNGPMSVVATWRADYTILYTTIATLIAIVGVAFWAAFRRARRNRKISN
jgi:hypothetical protein